MEPAHHIALRNAADAMRFRNGDSHEQCAKRMGDFILSLWAADILDGNSPPEPSPALAASVVGAMERFMAAMKLQGAADPKWIEQGKRLIERMERYT